MSLSREQPPDNPRSRFTRRAALGGLGGILVAGTLPVSEAAAQSQGEARSLSPRPSVEPLARRGATATLIAGRWILVAGGYHGRPLASAQVYDTQSGVWHEAAPMRMPRVSHAAALLRDGRVLVVGGMATGPLASAEIYDPLLDAWFAAAPMRVPRVEPTATPTPDGRIVVIGGFSGGPLASVEIYDGDQNAWSKG